MSTAASDTASDSTTSSPESTENPLALTAQDRCDHGDCSAAALTRVVFKDGLFLDFCGHHTAKLRDALVETGAVLHEQALV